MAERKGILTRRFRNSHSVNNFAIKLNSHRRLGASRLLPLFTASFGLSPIFPRSTERGWHLLLPSTRPGPERENAVAYQMS